MTAILGASSAIIAPFPSGPLTIVLSEISTDATGKSTVTWSDTLNGTKLAVGSSVTLPGTLATPSSSLIWGQVTYAYTPTLGYVITGTWTLMDQVYMSPRDSASITRINP
jgi:hypothetical protein